MNLFMFCCSFPTLWNEAASSPGPYCFPCSCHIRPRRDLGRVKASLCSWGKKPSVWAQKEMLGPRLGSGMNPELLRQPNWEASGR